jgi:predicted TIM-barrel fold metal-dependent hydrolase
MMKEAGVEHAILVPPSWEGDRVDYSLEAAQKYPNRFAVMGRFPIEKPSERAKLETWRDQKGMLGVRLTLHHEWDRGWNGCALSWITSAPAPRRRMFHSKSQPTARRAWRNIPMSTPS